MIELKAHGYTAWIDPERGGSCIRLERFGADVLRTPEGPQSYENGGFLWGTPLLFYPNRISGGCFEFEGREYRLPINEPKTGCFLHGTLNETPFEVIESGADYVTLQYAATQEKPYLTFMHAFTLTLAWKLTEKGLEQKVTFRNDSDLNMPVALAFHTTLRTPFCKDSAPENMRLTLDTSVEYSRIMATFLPDGGSATEYPGKQEMEEGTFVPCEHTISRFFRMGDKKCMRLVDTGENIQLTYQAQDPYGYWMVYNGGSKEFLCVEPQSWLSNCPNAPFPREEHGFDFIEPGKTRVYETLMNIEKI